MTNVELHPSFLALDRMAVADRADPAAHGHVAACARCARYVALIRAGQDVAPPALERRKPARRWWAALAAAALIGGAASALVLSTRGGFRAPDADTYTGIKGYPTVALYVKRSERVFLWSSGERVLPGDRLRLEVAADGFSHVAVLAKPSGSRLGQKLERVYDAPIDARKPTLLPTAWQVDDAPGDETLVVVLTRAPLGEQALSEVLRQTATSDDVWVERLVLPKPSDAGGP